MIKGSVRILDNAKFSRSAFGEGELLFPCPNCQNTITIEAYDIGDGETTCLKCYAEYRINMMLLCTREGR